MMAPDQRDEAEQWAPLYVVRLESSWRDVAQRVMTVGPFDTEDAAHRYGAWAANANDGWAHAIVYELTPPPDNGSPVSSSGVPQEPR